MIVRILFIVAVFAAILWGISLLPTSPEARNTAKKLVKPAIIAILAVLLTSGVVFISRNM